MKLFIAFTCFFIEVCFLMSILFLPLFQVYADEWTEVPPEVFDQLKGVDKPTSPIRIRLKDNYVDISNVISVLERVKESPYDNSFNLEVSFGDIILKTDQLCEKSNVPFRCQNRSIVELSDNVDRIIQDLEGQILYPDRYIPIKSEGGSRFFQEGKDFLDSDCLGSCDNYNKLTKTLRYSSPEEYAQLYDKIKTVDDNCQKDILNAFANKLDQEKFPKSCLKKGNQKHPVCESMSKDVDIVRGRALELAELAYGPDVLNTTEAKAPCMECIEKNVEDAHLTYLVTW